MGSLTSVWTWWLDGLTDAVVARAGARHDRDRVRLRPTREGAYQLDRAGTPVGGQPAIFVPGEPGHLAFGPPSVVERCQGRLVDLVLSPEEFLARTLDPLPSESKDYIDGIVLHNLERVTPWRSDDVLHTHVSGEVDANDDRLLVTLVATPRALVGPRMEALRAAGAAGVRLVAPGVGLRGDDVHIDVVSPEQQSHRRAAAQRKVVSRIALAAAVATVVVGGLAWAVSRAESRQELLAADIAKVRSGLLTPTSGTNGRRDAEAVWAKKLEGMPTVALLETLSAVLPDDTWLTELRFGEGRVRVVGNSRNVTALIPLLEKVPGLSAPRFFAPTVRLPGNQGNQFHLEAQLVPIKAAGQRASAAPVVVGGDRTVAEGGLETRRRQP